MAAAYCYYCEDARLEKAFDEMFEEEGKSQYIKEPKPKRTAGLLSTYGCPYACL